MINLPHILKQFHQVTNQVQSQSTPTYIQQRQIYQMPQPKQDVPMIQTVKIELDANLTIEQLNEHLKMNGRFVFDALHVFSFYLIRIHICILFIFQ